MSAVSLCEAASFASSFRRKCNDGLFLFRRKNDKLRVVHLENFLSDPPFGNLARKLFHLVAGASALPSHFVDGALPIFGTNFSKFCVVQRCKVLPGRTISFLPFFTEGAKLFGLPEIVRFRESIIISLCQRSTHEQGQSFVCLFRSRIVPDGLTVLLCHPWRDLFPCSFHTEPKPSARLRRRFFVFDCFFPHQLQYSEFSGISREQLQHFIHFLLCAAGGGGIHG